MQKTLAIALLVTAAIAHASPKTKSVMPAKPDPISLARERVKDLLKDPESARFRSEFIGRDGAVCGFVNSKNSYGGYGGFERYIVETGRVMIEGSEAWKMDSRWFDMCAEFEPAPR